jgi:hypothetical protein
MPFSRRSRSLGLVLCAAVLASCDKKGTQEPPPTPAIAVAAASSSVQVAPGGTATLNVNITRTGGFTGAVTVAAEGLPAGVTIAQATIPTGSTSGTLNISATAAAAAGNSTVTLRATGSGVGAATATFTLSVLEPPGMQISVSPTTVAVQQGTTGNVTVNLVRQGGFNGAVTVTVEGLPAAVTVAPATIAAGATSTTLTFTAALAAVVASTPVTVRASATGVTSQTAALNLTVTSAPVQPSITISLNPAALSVVQGGSGNFTVNLIRAGGFTGAVTLTAENLPTGVTIAGGTIPAGATSAQLTVNAAANAATTLSTITIRAAGTGVAAQTAALALTVTAPPSIAISLTPAGVSVPQGGSANFTVNVARAGGFTGAVTLTAEGTPPNVTIANATIAEGATSTQMTVNAGATALTGTTNMTIRATGTGVTAQTAALALTVTQAAGFTLSMNPAAISVQQGAQGQATVNLTRTGGFAGNVNLTATGAPAGMTVTFNPASAGGTQSAVTVAVGAGVTTGTYPITIRGNATGLAEQTTTLNVTVTVGGGGGNVTFQFCEANFLPIWFAAQDGDGAWNRVLPNANNQYTFQISSVRGGVAYVIQWAANDFDLDVLYMSRDELQAAGAQPCDAPPGQTKSVTLNFQGLAAFDMAFAALGSASTFTIGALPSVTLDGVPPGPVDLFASRIPASEGGVSFARPRLPMSSVRGARTRQAPAVASGMTNAEASGLETDRIVLQRALNPAAGSTVTVDFNGASSFAPVVRNLTIGNLGSDEASTFVIYRTAGNTVGTLGFSDQTGASQQYRGVPSNFQINGDFHQLFIFAQPPVQNPTTMRWAMEIFQAATDKTFTLGPILAQPTITTVETSPYARFRAVLPVQPEYNGWFVADFYQDTPSRFSSVQMSAAYLGGAATATLETPPLAGVSGFNSMWGPAAAPTTWTVQAFRFLSGDPTTTWMEGTRIQAAQREGTIVP